MNLKCLVLLSFVVAGPMLGNSPDLLPWLTMSDDGLRRFALQLGDRFDPETAFGAPEQVRTADIRVRIYPKGNRDLLIVETIPSAKGSGGEIFHAIRLKRAFEVQAAGLEAGTIRTVWEVCSTGSSSPAKQPLKWLKDQLKDAGNTKR